MSKRKTPDDYRRLAESRGLKMRKKTKEDYHALALKRGFKWLGTQIINTHTPTLWECNKGHQWEAAYTHIRNGSGCPFCSGCARKTEEDYNNLAIERGIEWVGNNIPPNNRTKTAWKCSREHQWYASYNTIHGGWAAQFVPIEFQRLP